MQAITDEFRSSPAYRRGFLAFKLAAAAVGVVGLAGLDDDLGVWGGWLGGIDSALVYATLYVLLFAVSAAALVPDVRRWRAARSVPRPKAPPPVIEAPQAEPAPEPPEPRPKSAPQAVRDEPLSDQLQRLLDEGVSLRRHVPAVIGIGGGFLHQETTEADIDMWARRTQRLLRERPELLAEFNYLPPRARFEALVGPSARLEPRYKRRFDQRIANLTGIISDLRHAGR